MKKNLLTSLALISIFMLSCQNQHEDSTKEKTPQKDNSNALKAEVEKWVLELRLNGEVGPPCKEDYNKWMEENPAYYWGLQKIDSLEFDINSDGIKDGLFYFPAENCVGGNGFGSDFAMLVYSHNTQLLTNKSITTNIEEGIKSALSANYQIYDVSRIVISYKRLNKFIEGTYRTWTSGDPSCCSSSKGTFKYNPIDFELIVKNKKDI